MKLRTLLCSGHIAITTKLGWIPNQNKVSQLRIIQWQVLYNIYQISGNCKFSQQILIKKNNINNK